MGRQLTTILRRAGFGSTRVAGPRTAEVQGGLASATAARARSLMPVAAGRRYDAVLAAADGPDAVAAFERTLAATWSLDAVTEMAGVWAGLSGPVRAAVVDPVRRLATAGRQTDRTTCGSAVLAMLNAAGDPALALWLATGTVLDVARPTELAAAPPDRLAELADAPVEHRFARLQQVLKRRSNAGGLLGLPWPAAFGTPPWGAARTARYAGLYFRHEMLDDTDEAHLSGVLVEVAAAVDRGVPVPLYSGGDTSRGWSTAVPRHLVLVMGRTTDGLTIWEPGSGRIADVPVAVLVAGGVPVPALGHWHHLTWAVLPEL
ncbi:hypothetical protein [Cellulomonas sp. KRMCY2]|uniref:hypothetical protein n=1 Tax=Cellulomonas sp. KRMCY2 TaxID=1304865 RepID=UPI00045E9C6D|nr:hypothetical protein [Cellulomonas sp. KRMCY2]